MRVHRYLKKVAVPVQYSLFLAEDTAHGIRRVRDGLASEIDDRADDVRIYLLPSRPRIVHYGRHPLPAGLLLLTADPARATWELSKRAPDDQ